MANLRDRTSLSPLGNSVLARRKNVRYRYKRQTKKQWNGRVPIRGRQPGQNQKENADGRTPVGGDDAGP